MKSTLLFVYNADSGLFNTLTDIAHKIFAPQTYACNLCALTHSPFGMRKEWKAFLATLDRPMEFLHANELKNQYGISDIPLPVIFAKDENKIELRIDAAAINACRNLDELKTLITSRA